MIYHFKIAFFRIFIFTVLIGSSAFSFAQRPTRITTLWTDDYKEWEIETDSSDFYGHLRVVNSMEDNPTRWTIEFGDKHIDIRKVHESQNIWEAVSSDQRITFQPTWPRDLRFWRFTNNELTYHFDSRYENRFDEWLAPRDEEGELYMYTYEEQNPGDWIIEDFLTEDFPLEMKLAMIFSAIYNTVEKPFR